jgi:hypothetical protein
MPHAVLDRSAFDALFSLATYWPSDGHWDSAARDTAEHVIEHPKTGMLMVLVPAGQLHTNTGGAPREVDLPAYYVAVHPVTNAQYARFVSETGHRPPDNLLWQEAAKKNHPVTNVSWVDAMDYCHWAGLRLPTALEWMKAWRLYRAYFGRRASNNYVQEWCVDGFNDNGSRMDPLPTSSPAKFRLLNGGSAFDFPGLRASNNGFRCVVLL